MKTKSEIEREFYQKLTDRINDIEAYNYSDMTNEIVKSVQDYINANFISKEEHERLVREAIEKTTSAIVGN